MLVLVAASSGASSLAGIARLAPVGCRWRIAVRLGRTFGAAAGAGVLGRAGAAEGAGGGAAAGAGVLGHAGAGARAVAGSVAVAAAGVLRVGGGIEGCVVVARRSGMARPEDAEDGSGADRVGRSKRLAAGGRRLGAVPVTGADRVGEAPCCAGGCVPLPAARASACEWMSHGSLVDSRVRIGPVRCVPLITHQRPSLMTSRPVDT